MSNEICEFINTSIKTAQAIFNQAEAGDSSININPESITEVCHHLKNSSEYEFSILQAITGTDYPEEIEVSYILASFTKNLELILKAKLPKNEKNEIVEIKSVSSVWKAANFQERECFDMLGVNFLNHPDMRRILCPEDWEGYPLRKDYIVQEVYRGMVVNPASKINQEDHDFQTNLKLKLDDPKTVLGSWKGHVTPKLAIEEKERTADIMARAKALKAKIKAEADAKKAEEEALKTKDDSDFAEPKDDKKGDE